MRVMLKNRSFFRPIFVYFGNDKLIFLDLFLFYFGNNKLIFLDLFLFNLETTN